MLVSGAMPSFRDRLRKKSRDSTLDRGLLAGREHEAVGAGQAPAVEQRVDDDCFAAAVGRTTQNSRKYGELLAAAVGGVDREAARREPVDEVAATARK